MQTHVQRIEAALALQTTDRLPFSLWFHFPNRDRSPRRLAELCLHYQKELDLDFVKFMPYGLYSCVDYGLDLKVFPGILDAPVALQPVITKPEDWDKIKPVSGLAGEYAIVLEAQRIFMNSLTCAVPLVQTIFSPLTTALKLCDETTLLSHLRSYPQKVHQALEVITTTTLQFARAVMAEGAAGLFFATQVSCEHQLTVSEHDEFVAKYDLAILEDIKHQAWFNICHLHGAGARFETVKNYPIHAFNWHDRDDGPSLAEIRKQFPDKTLCGGLSHINLAHQGSEAELAAQIKDSWQLNQDLKGVIFTPGCVLNSAISMERLKFISQTIKSI